MTAIPNLGTAWLARTLLLFAVVSAVVTLGALPIANAYNAGRLDVITAREQGYAERAALDIENALREVFADLRVVARLPAMREFLDEEPTLGRERKLAGALKDVMEAYGRYSQIRLLDLAGREMVRLNDVDGHTTVVPHEALQKKPDRNYFKAAASLEHDQIYLSPIDLDAENGAIEVPFVATLRVATRVYDASGNNKAILVLNVHGSALLDRFREMVKAEPLHQPMLLDRDGFWLSGGADDKEWGFMFGRSEAAFGSAYPVEWRAVAAGDHGALRTASGLFVYSTVYPPAPAPREIPPGSHSAPTGSPAGRQHYLKIVLRVPEQTLRRMLLPYLPLGRVLIAAIYLLLLLLCGLVSWILLDQRRTRDVERAVARELEDFYERAPCGYHSVDRSGLVVRMNQTELDWLGYGRDEVVGKMKITDLMNADGRQAFAENFPRLVESGRVGNVDFEFVRKDGGLLPVSVNASAVRDDRGQFLMSRSTVFDMTERRKLERELARQASTDPLTGIGNRRYFFDLAEHELSRARRTRKPLSLLLIDIDEFKTINDRFGHDAGDAVLKAMTAACRGILRQPDVFARIGGEEFVVLMPDTDAAQAQVIAERVRERLARDAVPRGQGPSLRYTVSIGVACLEPADGTEGIDAVMHRADIALYQAKNAGRDCVRAMA